MPLGPGLRSVSGPQLGSSLSSRASLLSCLLLEGPATHASNLAAPLARSLEGSGGIAMEEGWAEALAGPGLMDSGDEEAFPTAARLLALAVLSAPSRSSAGDVGARAAARLTAVAGDATAPEPCRVAALAALSDCWSAVGAGGLPSPAPLAQALLAPIPAMGLAGPGAGGAGAPLQAAAGLALARLALTGGLPCAPEAVAGTLPLWQEKGEKPAPIDPASVLPALGALFDLRAALLWRVAAGEEGEGEALASPLASLTALFPAFAALGPVHKAAALSACLAGVGRARALCAALGLDGRAASFGGETGFGLDGEGEEGSEGEEAEVKAKPKGPAAPKAPVKGRAGGGDAASVASGVSGVGGGGSAGSGAGAAWLASGLALTLAVASVSPVGEAAASYSSPVPPSCLPPWLGGDAPTPASALLASWLVVEAVCEARDAGLASPHMPALLGCLKALPAPPQDGAAPCTAAEITAAGLGAELPKLPLRGGVATLKTVARLAEAWARGRAPSAARTALLRGAVSAAGGARAAAAAAAAAAVAIYKAGATAGGGTATVRASSRAKGGNKSYAEVEEDG